MLSVVLATYNEANNITRCLNSVQSLADEIIVIDGSSTDNTRNLAKKLGAKVIKTSNPSIFHVNKQKGLEQARGDWILQLDADEEITPTLANEIKKTINLSENQIRDRQINLKKQKLFFRHQKILEHRDGNFDQASTSTVAFFIPRLNIFLGKPLRYGGVYPDGVIRLVKKGKANFPCRSVHEQIKINGRVDWLENDLLHHDSPTFEKYLHRANRYTDLTAQQFQQANIPLNPINHVHHVVIKSTTTFFSIYLRHQGFRDGFRGFVWALFSALHHPIAYFKYWELKHSNRKS